MLASRTVSVLTKKWIQDGMHGEMSYLDRHQEKKGDLQKVLPGIKSVISLATSYLPPQSSAPHPETLTGKVARYARFEDYHHVLEAPLKALCKELETLGGKGHTHLHYVDTGPIMERTSPRGLDWGSRASIPISFPGSWAIGFLFPRYSPPSN